MCKSEGNDEDGDNINPRALLTEKPRGNGGPSGVIHNSAEEWEESPGLCLGTESCAAGPKTTDEEGRGHPCERANATISILLKNIPEEEVQSVLQQFSASRKAQGQPLVYSIEPGSQWEAWRALEAGNTNRACFLHGGMDVDPYRRTAPAMAFSNPNSSRFHSQEFGAVPHETPSGPNGSPQGTTGWSGDDTASSSHDGKYAAVFSSSFASYPQNSEQSKTGPQEEQSPGFKREETCLAVDGVRENDVLCGRGEHVNRHPGNKLFHEMKERLQRRYLLAVRRREKTAIAQELVDTMKREYGSRFLGYCSETKKYIEIDNRRVLEKAKQVLREVFTAEQRRVKREKYFRPKKKMFYAQCLADLKNAPT